MKLIELFENTQKSYLDISKYGAWINSKTMELIPVDFQKHLLTIFRLQRAENPDAEYDRDAYHWGYDAGYVRIAHQNAIDEGDVIRGELTIQGTPVSIKQIWPRIRKDAIRFSRIFITLMEDGYDRSKAFYKHNPSDYRTIPVFLNSYINETMLVEQKEYLPVMSHYGAWVDSATKQIHPVSFQNHEDVAERLQNESEKPSENIDSYSWAFQNGYVRIVHPHIHRITGEYGNLEIQGFPKDIMSAWPVIKPTSKMSESTMIDVIKHEVDEDDYRRTFANASSKFFTTSESILPWLKEF